jgi:nucleoside-diphosphate-sugar epimerase
VRRRRQGSDGTPHRVLVTGAGGLIGGILIDGLARAYEVRGVDVVPGRRVDHVVDLTDADAAAAVFAGADAVVDLAADSDADATWQTVHDNNLRATTNSFEAARAAGVKRVVFASSNHVVGMYEREEPYASIVRGEYEGLDPTELRRLTAAIPIRPDGPYGIGKAFGEAAARYYADEHGISMLCLRIGTVNAEGRPLSPRQFATLLTHRDLVQLVERCLAAPPDVRYAVLYGVSANTWRFWDLEEARETIGYEPRDDAEAWR